MLKHLQLRDIAIVDELAVDLGPGFTVLTGETGAGKSILVDALQLALGQRADASVVRDGAQRAEVGAEFDTPAALRGWLDEAGFAVDDTLLLRRSVDVQGRSRAWINGSPATLAQLREAADALVDIHGQHAWQSLTRPAAVRALLDAQSGVDTREMAAAWQAWRVAQQALDEARARQDTLERERERLAWQVGELAKLAPSEGEWEQLDAEHQRLSHAQALLDASRLALDAVRDADMAADGLTHQAITALDEVARYDAELQAVAEVLRGAAAQLEDAAHTLAAYLARSEPDPDRLAELDTRMAAWMSLARRWRRPPAELPALAAAWQAELAALDAATDLQALQAQVTAAEQRWRTAAQAVSRARSRGAQPLAQAVTAAMQQLGMAGGRFEVALLPQDGPQPFGLENVEFRVAGHAGSTPRALGKVASGGELSRLALAISVSTTASAQQAGSAPATLIFDEIDAGVGGTVADSVGRLMKQLGRNCQVLAVTHLAQVAACADAHLLVAKALNAGGQTVSSVQPVAGEARVAEIARMLGGERFTGTSRAHAQALLAAPAQAEPALPGTPTPTPGGPARRAGSKAGGKP
jgi:DNA repair protein RecN (Recombination protein N)